MSGLAGLYVLPETPEDWRQWSFVHASHHRDINRIIFQTTGIVLQEFPLDPIDAGDFDSWLLLNQTLHVEMDAILGINSYNLEALDPKDQASLQTWIRNHGQEHYQAAAILGIG